MMPIIFLSPAQMKAQIANRAKQIRLDNNLSRKTLSAKSGVPESTIKHFEVTGDISLGSLLNLARALDCLNEFNLLFAEKPPTSLFLPAPIKRQRGRK